MTKILADGIIFHRDPQGGIARLYREIWPRMCDLDPDLRITLFVDGKMPGEVVSHPQIVQKKSPYVRRWNRSGGKSGGLQYPIRRMGARVWKQARSLWIGTGAGMLWHSTYYTQPTRWQGLQVVTVYDLIHEQFPDLFNSRLDNIARQQKMECIVKADAIICISDTTRLELQRIYGQVPGTVHVIPVGLSEVFRRLEPQGSAPSGLPPGPFILYIGKRSHHKNFRTLIQAYQHWARNMECSLVVVGSPWDEDEEKYLSELSVTDQVHLLENVTDGQLCQLYNYAAGFVYPSLYEGFGLPVIEAMSCGCPVIASQIPSTLEVAGDIPFYFDPLDTEGLMAALDQALRSGREPERVKSGIERASRFTWDQTARNYLSVYHGLATQ